MSIYLPFLSVLFFGLAVFLVSFPSAVWKYLPQRSVWRVGRDDSACFSVRLRWWLCGIKAGLTRNVRACIPSPRLGTRNLVFIVVTALLGMLATLPTPAEVRLTEIDTVAVGNQPAYIALTPDGSKLYVVNFPEDILGNISVVDTSGSNGFCV